MKERLDILLVKKGLAQSREKGEGHYYVRHCLCRWAKGRQGRYNI